MSRPRTNLRLFVAVYPPRTGHAIAGCGVMLFNWIAINFVIVGLHSYA